MSSFTPLFTKHSRTWQENRYVYPVISRRSKGLSIGVNLNPDKICNFDCIYCCVDRSTMPGKLQVDLTVLRDELQDMLARVASRDLWNHPPFDQTPDHLRRLNDVAFSGDGEPTSFQEFHSACEITAQVIDAYNSIAGGQMSETSADQSPALDGVKIVVITNATLFHQPRVQKALSFLDDHQGELWAKLDAGTEQYYKLVERTSVPFQRVIDNLLDAGRRRSIVIQTLFMNVNGSPPDDAEIEAYCGVLKQLVSQGCSIKLVQIYTVARGPAEHFVSPIGRTALDAISNIVQKATGLNVETFYGPD